MNILIVGAGTIATRVALACTVSGHSVLVLGRPGTNFAKARGVIDAAFAEIKRAQLLPPTAAGWRERLEYSSETGSMMAADLAIEAVNEDLSLKRSVFEMLEQQLPSHAILASSTSGLAVDAIAARCAGAERIAVAHFANPAHLMPLVELVPGSRTSEETMNTLSEFVRTLGKKPIRLRRDIPGHLFNRIQFAMLREAIALVEGGVASVEDVDEVVKSGLALRLAEEGPLEKMDLAGLELVASVAAYLFPSLDCSQRPTMLQAMLQEGRAGALNGRGFYTWTDDRVAEVLSRRNTEVVRHLVRRARQELNNPEAACDVQ